MNGLEALFKAVLITGIISLILWATSCTYPAQSPRPALTAVSKPPRSISYPINPAAQITVYTTIIWIMEDMDIGWHKPGWQYKIIDEYIVTFDDNDDLIFSDGGIDTEKKEILIFQYSDCFADSSIAAGLAEAIGHDPNDEQIGKIVIEITEHTRARAIKKFCGEGYVPKPRPTPILRSNNEQNPQTASTISP